MLLELLNSADIEIIEQAIWGLGNIAADSAKVRDMVIAAGTVSRIANILDQAMPGSSLMSISSWTLSIFCRG